MKKRINKHTIIGGGLSALIKDQITDNAIIYCSSTKRLSISKNFYENLEIGGNTNIWGGYINYKKYLMFLKHNKFRLFIKYQKIFKLKKLFIDRKFKDTYFISNFFDNKVLRIKNFFFKNPLISKKINKISIEKKKIFIHYGNDKVLSNKLSICVGNLSLIEMLYNSKIINIYDRISFKDGSCSYCLNFKNNFKQYYYIPLTIKEIIEKLFFGKKEVYKSKIGRTLIAQKFSKKYIIHSFSVFELLKYKSNNIRYFLTNHTTNLKINGVEINKFMKNLSKNITVYNSGSIKRYIPGPISQNLIFNVIKNSKFNNNNFN